MNDHAVCLEGVTKSFGGQTAVSALDLAIPRGAIYGLLGPNGSGKTTTIRMIMGILGPDSGRVALFGGDPGETRRRRVGYLPEERGLYRRMKVLEQLVFLARIRGVSSRVANERAMEWLERLELADHREKRLEDLSKGMQQKVQFIGTVLHEPDLLILDEPFSGLDPINQDVLEDIVREFAGKGTTILFSTHLMDQAERLCQRVCLISRSRKVLDGEIGALKRAERLGVVALDFEGSRDWLDLPQVTGVDETPTGVRVRLREGADPQLLLEAAMTARVRLGRFQVVEPRLHEIFVRHVRRDPSTEPVQGSVS
ncbi:MAG: ATP-binding cassette domain-containing protein [Gemmatimonadales bacterium]|nr:MAG: ATP-binding cassette domain-containing protein [Gemmatimonadales bacterium]